uniref:20S proteasome A and B subunits n=1 Tax=Desulfobacca acetoxidans TaxID=60893 RepID=A0A7C3Z0L2_9BACT
MGQLIACATAGGILVASDSRTEFFEPDGTVRFINQNHLIPVTSHAVLASAGAWESQDICQEFAGFAKAEGLTDVDDLIEAAIPFFIGKYDEILRKICTIVPPDPIINMYLLLAGYAPKTPNNPYKIFVIWDRPKPPKIEYNQVTHIFTLPRRMGLEFTLNSLVAQNASLTRVAETVRTAMEKLAAQDERLGPPYQYLAITNQGVHQI